MSTGFTPPSIPENHKGRRSVPCGFHTREAASDPLTGFLHQRTHVADRLGQTVEGGATDDGVTDVELIELGDRGDSLDVVVVQAVARIDLQALASGVGSSGGDALELGVALGIRGGIGVAAGVDLDEGSTARGGRIDLQRIRIDEEDT